MLGYLSLYAKDHMPFLKYKTPEELLPDVQSLSLDIVSVLKSCSVNQIIGFRIREALVWILILPLLCNLEQLVYSLSALVLPTMRWSWWLNAWIYIKVFVHFGHRTHLAHPFFLNLVTWDGHQRRKSEIICSQKNSMCWTISWLQSSECRYVYVTDGPQHLK